MDNGTTQSFELASEDVGAGADGFIANFAMSTIEVSSGTTVEFIDEHDNRGSGAAEALYVDTLILRAASEIVLNDVNVYYDTLDNDGGTVTLLGEG